MELIPLEQNEQVDGDVPEEMISSSPINPNLHIAHDFTCCESLANSLPFVPMTGASGVRHDPTCVHDLQVPAQLGNSNQLPQDVAKTIAYVRSRLAGRVTRNEQVFGLVDLTAEDITLRQQAYADFFCTNGAFGFPLNTGQALGQLLVSTYNGLPPFVAGTGAHTLGVASLVETADGWIILGLRGAKTGVNRGINVPTSGGVQYRDLRAGDTLWDLLRETVQSEAHEELGLVPTQYEIVPVGAARECPRGGSPEWFFLLRSTLTHEDFARQYANHAHADKHEHTALFRVKRDELYASLDSMVPLQKAIHPKAVLAALFARRAMCS